MNDVEKQKNYNFVRDTINRADASFNMKDLNEAIKAVNKFFDSKYSSIDESVDIISDFEKLKNDRIIKYSAFQKDDAIFSEVFEQIISDPQKAINLFINSENKKDFISSDDFIIEYDKEKNFINFVKFLFNSISKQIPLERLVEIAQTNKNRFIDAFKKNIEPIYKSLGIKEKLIENILYNTELLQKLDSYKDMFLKQNELYTRTRLSTLKDKDYEESGFMIFSLSSEEMDNIYSKENLQNCNVMQLEAILSFLINRSEKVFDKIATGMYLYYVNSIETADEEHVKDNHFLKTMWQKKLFFTEFSKDFIKNNKDKFIEFTSETGSNYGKVEVDEIISYLENYKEAYNSFFPDSDIVTDYNRFDKIIGGGIYSRYIGKDKLLESLIIYSDKTKSNWGYTKEEGKKYKDKLLLSFDVPGLNMPIRLHANKEKIKRLMTDYLKTSEIPVYCGAEDFTVYENPILTHALYPVSKSKVNRLKTIVEKGRISPGFKNCAEHIKLLQLDNSRKRILKWKGMDFPQYYDLLKNEIITPELEEQQSSVNLSNIKTTVKKNNKKKK